MPGTSSRLLIHAAGANTGPSWPIGTRVRRLWARFRHELHRRHVPSSLEVRDLHGSQLLRLTEAGHLVDLVLPTGTYLVTTRVGEDRRSYTVVLQGGVTTHLHLRTRHD